MEYPATNATLETLPNGLSLILDPDPAAPVVSCQIWVETGSIHEDRLLGSGLSHFLEHMVFKGTRDFSSDELARTVQAAGGQWNAYTTFERTVYYIDGPSASLETFLRCLTGIVFFPLLPEADFANEQDVIRREIDMGHDDPDNAATRLLLSTAFQHDPRKHPVIGHRHLFDNITHRDLTDYHRARYTTDRCCLVISGDFDAAQARQWISELTADCKAGAGAEPFIAHDPAQLGLRQARETFAIPVSRIALAWKIPPLGDADTPAYEALATMLGKGRSALLYQTFREGSGLALEVSCFAWNDPEREGLFAISADAEVEKRDELIRELRSFMEKLPDLLTEEDLAKTKRQVLASQFGSLLSASGRAGDLASNWHEARDLDFTRAHVAAIESLSLDDLRRVARSLAKRGFTQTVLDPLDAPAPETAKRSSQALSSVELHRLSNGLPVAFVRDHRVPLVRLQAAIRAGLPSETKETSGINQLLASTLDKGAAGRAGVDIARDLESLGAAVGANAGNNAVLVQAAGLTEDFPAIMGIFAEVITRPDFPTEAVSRESASQKAALEEARHDPLTRCFKALREAAFDGRGYGLDVQGSSESLARLDQAALADQHRRLFQANNMALVVAGDVDVSQALPLIEAALASLPSGEAFTPPADDWSGEKTIDVSLPKKQAVITIGYRGLGASDPDRYALQMIQEYAADMAGPLFGRIREELGLAYQVGATQFHGFDTGLFTFYLATSPEQADAALQELAAQIENIAKDGIPDEAFERVRSTLLAGFAMQRQSPAVVARHVALDVLFGHEADEFLKQHELVANLTAATVRDVARRIFSTAPVTATVKPSPSPEQLPAA